MDALYLLILLQLRILEIKVRTMTLNDITATEVFLFANMRLRLVPRIQM